MSDQKAERLKVLNPRESKGKVLWLEVGTLFIDLKSKKGTLYLNHTNIAFKVVPWDSKENAAGVSPEDPEYIKSLLSTTPSDTENGSNEGEH